MPGLPSAERDMGPEGPPDLAVAKQPVALFSFKMTYRWSIVFVTTYVQIMETNRSGL